jgi:hypothetical protein
MPASDYNPNIPQPTDTGATMQPAVLLNFGAIQDLIDVDHVDFAATGAGKHYKVTFPVQTLAPAFIVGEVGLFNLNSPVTTINELYITKSSGVTFPMSASILSTNPAPANNTPGWAYLPSGMLIKWGNSVATGSTTILFPVAANIPVFSTVVSAGVTTTGAGTDTFAQLTTFSSVGMVVYGSQRTAVATAATTFQYYAIGY